MKIKIICFLFFCQFHLTAYEYELAICTIFKDCTPFLKEWIEFHRMIGVEHFYLYDNSSSDNPLEVLRDYIDQNVVTYTYWPNLNEEQWRDQKCAWVSTTQLTAYYDARDRVMDKVKWLAFIDSDEFLVPVKDNDLKQFLKKHELRPGIEIFWQVYGTSNVYELPVNTLMIELLTLKCDPSHSINLHTKIIVRPRLFKYFSQPPHKGNYFKILTPYKPNINEIRINHYINRTEKFFYEHKIKGKETMDNAKWSQGYIEEWSKLGNDVEDRIMDRFIPELRRRMGFE